MASSTELDRLQRTIDTLQQENRQLRDGYLSLSQQLIGLRMVQHVTQDLVSEMDIDRLLKRILHSAIHSVQGTAGSLLLLDPTGQELVFEVVEGGGGIALEGQRMARNQGLAGWAVTEDKPLIVRDVRTDSRFYECISKQVDYEVTSLLCAPLRAKGEPLGAVQVLNKANGEPFSDEDLTLLTSFAAQSAIAIENMHLYLDLKRERDRLIAREEQVRKRLARDLHDGPAQLLANLISSLEFAAKLLEREPGKVPEELANLHALAQKALLQVRTLLFDLRPVVLETQGLAPALASYIEQQTRRGDLTYHFRVDGLGRRLPRHAERAVFSIVQEAINNVKRHAQAHNVWLSITEEAGTLWVEMRDDGCGFDVERMEGEYAQRGSLGMLNMRERAAAIGGNLSVQSQPKAGTTIGLEVDLSPLRETSRLEYL
jgi:signal transduction histidine kinase